MKYEYDAKTDILVLKLSTGKPDFGERKNNLITHYSKNGKPVQIEILDASKTVVDMLETIIHGKKRIIEAKN